MSDAFPFVSVSGAPNERGFQLGRAAGDRIRASVEIYSRAFDAVNLGWKDVFDLARGFMPRIAAYDADLLEEMRGIATGAELELEKIIALNARTELLYRGRKGPLTPLESTEGCTGLVAMPNVTASGRLFHAQNWDWIAECVNSAIVIRHEMPDGTVYLGFNEAGTLARAGFNSRGVALTGNFLGSDRDQGAEGVPIPFVRRRVLTSGSLEEGVEVIHASPRSFSNNMMVSQANGRAVNLETTPVEIFRVEPERGLIVHANHFRSPVAKATVRDTGIQYSPDSLYRDIRVESRLEPHLGRITEDHIKEALADDFGSPAAVCRAPTPGPGGADCATVATIVMDAALGTMWIAPAPYLGEPVFTEYSI
jgi:isopenicillin-N N-acyltransferase-like protein